MVKSVFTKNAAQKITAFAAITAVFMAAMVVPAYSVEAAEPTVSAKAAILIEAKSGNVIFGKNADEQRAMASTTKIMSALLTLEAGDLDRKFTVDPLAIKVEGSSMGLVEGDIVTRHALVQGMLLPSGNDAANAAAVSVSGSINAFVDLMNSRAEQLGLDDTHFVTPSGLDANGHYTTAHDLARLAAYAIQNEEFAAICSQTAIKTEFGNPVSERWLKNSNKMLKFYGGANGVKTGFTDDAGRCLVSSAERDGLTLIAVTLYAPDDWNDHIRMLDYGFAQYEKHSVGQRLEVSEIAVAGGEKESVKIKAAESVEVWLTAKQRQNLRGVVLLPRFVYAGVSAGERVGTIKLVSESVVVGEIPIFTAEECKIKEQSPSLWDMITDFFG